MYGRYPFFVFRLTFFPPSAFFRNRLVQQDIADVRHSLFSCWPYWESVRLWRRSMWF